MEQCAAAARITCLITLTFDVQERAEEARYIRLREKAAMEARKEAAKGDKDLEDAMHDAAGIIAATHDKISQEGLLNLAKWKLGRLS